jgi:hypothetical protein
VRYAGALENLYDLEGHPGHEIVLVYEARSGRPGAIPRRRDVTDLERHRATIHDVCPRRRRH